MPKTENNSTRCSCCHRFMARKSGKRQTCSERCRKEADDLSKKAQRQQKRERRYMARKLNRHAGLF